MFGEMFDGIERWRRDFLNPYCRTKCSEKGCCTSLQLNGLKGEELLFLYDSEDPGIIKDLERDGKIEIERDFWGRKKNYTLLVPCPKFDHEHKTCTVYNDPKRPDSCEIFPLEVFLDEGKTSSTLFLNDNCEMVSRHSEKIKEYLSRLPSVSKVLVGQ